MMSEDAVSGQQVFPFASESAPLPPGEIHRVAFVDIRNFRACKHVALELGPYTPLVGPNNVGKSTILRAISWVLSPKKLPPEAFADQEHPVVVAARIEGVNAALLRRIHDPKHRTAIEPFCVNGVLWVRVRQDLGKNLEKEVWDPAAPDVSRVPSTWKRYPTGLPQAVGTLLPEPIHVDATKDMNEDLGKAKAGTTIKALLDEVMQPVVERHPELQESLDKIVRVLGQDGSGRSALLTDFDKEASAALAELFPGLALQLALAPVNVDDFFKNGELQITDLYAGDRRSFGQMGAGAQRSVQMALVRYLADSRSSRTATPARRMLLIDEPELFLHPRGVRHLQKALHALSARGFQVVFTTHSALMLGKSNAGSTVIVSKNARQGTQLKTPLRNAVKAAIDDAAAAARTLFELEKSTEIYFADRVVLVEGKTDRVLLPLLHERYGGADLPTKFTAFVSVGGCNMLPKAPNLLRAMNVLAFAVADLDFAFVGEGRHMLPKSDVADRARAVFHRLKHSSPRMNLGHNGFPQKSAQFKPSDGWRAFANDHDGAAIADLVHKQLRRRKVWLWTSGDIESVLSITGKGEDVIAEQEMRFSALTPGYIRKEFPKVVEFFRWSNRSFGVSQDRSRGT